MKARLRRCERCAAWCRDPPGPRSTPSPRLTLPTGWRCAYHLCRDCRRRFKAVRSDLWGGIGPPPAATPDPAAGAAPGRAAGRVAGRP